MLNLVPNMSRMVNLPRAGLRPHHASQLDLTFTQPLSAVPPKTLFFPAKANADILDYSVCITDWFDGTGDSISSVDVDKISPSDGLAPLIVKDKRYTAETVIVVLSGGLPGQTYTLTFKITTQMGLILSVPLSIQINSDPIKKPPISIPGILPPDFARNGPLFLADDAYVTGGKPMPEGLFLHGSSPVVMTDGRQSYYGTTNNFGLLMADGDSK